MIRAEVVVVGGGPAGVLAALRAGDLGARTVIVTKGELGGMAADDGPVPVRTLAHAARLMRDARKFGRYGIAGTEPTLDYERLLARVREVVADVQAHSALRTQIKWGGFRGRWGQRGVWSPDRIAHCSSWSVGRLALSIRLDYSSI